MKEGIMKIKFNSIFFISLLFLPTYNTVTSEPEGTGVFALNVDDNPELKKLAQKIIRAIERELGGLKERLGRGVREELARYETFEKEIAGVLDAYDVARLQEIAQKNFPDIYPTHMNDPKVYENHPALRRIYKLIVPTSKPKIPTKTGPRTAKDVKRAAAAARKTQEKIARAKKALVNFLHRTKDQFNAFKNSLDAAGIIPTPILHITLCECGATGCSKRSLKQLFSKFYGTPTQSVEFSIEEIAVYDEGSGWIILKIKSLYLDKLIQRLRKNGTFKCNVRTPFRAHISILKFRGLEGGHKNTVFQLLRTFLTTVGADLLPGSEKPYCIDIKEFGIKEREIKYLYSS